MKIMDSGFTAQCARLSLILAAVLLLSSCSRLGWGVLLWYMDEPAVPSGAILPVYIKSNIDQVWVVGIPDMYWKSEERGYKVEIPLWQLELVGSRKKAEKWARDFAELSNLYAENLQDGLPIRDSAENSARRVYRLRAGEIVKILAPAEGSPPISATGEPLEGEWYKVLTESGTIGYCFSYRLRLFDHYSGEFAVQPAGAADTADPYLELVFSKTWSPEIYDTMINNKRINLDDLSRRWRFDPGRETGLAQLFLPQLERTFSYTEIRPEGFQTWRFEGTTLMINLRTETSLMVQFNEAGGARRSFMFTALTEDVGHYITQETTRRGSLYRAIYNQGPIFTSNNYGTINFLSNQRFTWTGYSLLVPHIISAEAADRGAVSMDLYLSDSMSERYNGAFSLRFTGAAEPVRFLYVIDAQGFRLEHIPASSLDEITVFRRANSPTVLYFFKDSTPPNLSEG